MDVPAGVLVLGQLVLVVEPERMSDENKLGEFFLRRLRIEVRADQADGSKRDTVLHEVLHAIHSLLGMEVEESLVHALTPVLLDVLRANPELVSFLTEP